MNKTVFSTLLAVLFLCILSGCANSPATSSPQNQDAKLFQPPADGKANIYFYRDSSISRTPQLKRKIYVNQQCVGILQPHTFIMVQVDGNEDYTLSTGKPLSPYGLKIHAQPNKTYFILQYLKMGQYGDGSDLIQAGESQGKKDIDDQREHLVKSESCN